MRRSIRVNTLKISVTDFKKRIKDWSLTPVPWCKQGFWVEHKEGRRDIGNLTEHALGYFYVQEAASMIPPLVLDPQPGDIILDLHNKEGLVLGKIKFNKILFTKINGLIDFAFDREDKDKAIDVSYECNDITYIGKNGKEEKLS